MASPSMSKIRHFLNHAPFWRRYPAHVILLSSLALISKALIYRFHTGGWEMDWAGKFSESLFWGVFMGLYFAWPRGKGAGKNEHDERQRTEHYEHDERQRTRH
jgi:hypothetical protein